MVVPDSGSFSSNTLFNVEFVQGFNVIAYERDRNNEKILNPCLPQLRDGLSCGGGKPFFRANLALERKRVRFIMSSLRHHDFHRFSNLLGIWIAAFYQIERCAVRRK